MLVKLVGHFLNMQAKCWMGNLHFHKVVHIAGLCIVFLPLRILLNGNECKDMKRRSAILKLLYMCNLTNRAEMHAKRERKLGGRKRLQIYPEIVKLLATA